MAAQRILQGSASRLLLGRQVLAASRQIGARRTAATAATSEANIVAKQRLNRPVAPHLTIYKPQITWIASSLNRITGLILSGGLYLYAIGYLVGPTVGLHFESAVLASTVAAWGVAAKVATKFTLAMPFAFHSLNGVRHLLWDTGAGFGKLQVIRTGWFVVGLTAVSSLYLTFGY